VGSGGFWVVKGLATAVRINWVTFPSGIPIFIMSAWAEEQGFKGVLLALGLYMALLLRLVQNATAARKTAQECFW